MIMKKLLVISLLCFSSMVHSEWIVLSCKNESGLSTIIEFDPKKQKIRVNNDSRRFYSGKITDHLITWSPLPNFYNQIDRITGVYSYMGPNDVKINQILCSKSNKKF